MGYSKEYKYKGIILVKKIIDNPKNCMECYFAKMLCPIFKNFKEEIPICKQFIYVEKL